MMYKTLYRNLKIEQHEPHKTSRVNSGAPEESAVPMTQIFRSCYPSRGGDRNTFRLLSLR